MYIMTNCNPAQGVVEVLDTSDCVREQMFLAPLANRLHQSRNLKIYGIRRGIEQGANLYPFPVFGLTLAPKDAEQAMKRFQKSLVNN